MRPRDITRPGWFASTVTVLVVGAMILPLVVVILTSINPTNELAFPPYGVSGRWYQNILRRSAFIESFRFSVILASLATVGSLGIGLLAAVALVRYRFRGREAILAFVMSPLLVPEVVTGMAILVLLSRLHIYRSFPALAILHPILTLPYTIRVLAAALATTRPSLEEAAMALGATRFGAFVRVTLPAMRPGVVAAGIFAFVTSFDNFTASQFLVWDRVTLPVEIYSYIRTETDPTASAISTVLILLTVGLVLLMERWVGLDIVTG